jgi:hypothetical protein
MAVWKTLIWSSALFAPAFPGRSAQARISPEPFPGAVIGGGDERGEPVAALVRAGDVFLIGVRGHERRVNVDDERVRGRRSQGRVPVPGGVPGSGAQFPGEAFHAIAEQLRVGHGPFEEPGNGRVRGQLTKDPGEERRMSRSEACSPPAASITASEPRTRPGR